MPDTGGEDQLCRQNDELRKRVAELEATLLEREQADAALRESEELFKCFMEHSPTCVFFKDSNLRSLRLSRSFETLVGKPLAEQLGKSMEQLFPAELAKSMIEDDLRIMREGREVTVEEEFNGRFYSTTKFPISLAGEPRYLAGFTTDITERKRAENGLRESEARYRYLFDASPDGIVIIGNDGLIRSANLAQCRMYRYDTPAGLVGISPLLLIAPEMRDVAANVMSRRLKGEEISPVEYRLLRKDGTSFYGETSSAALRNADGSILGYLCITRDITRRKQAEEKLRESETRLMEAQRIANIGNWELDLVTNTLSWSDEIFRIFEIDKETFGASYEAFLSAIHPEDRDAVNAAYTRSLETREPYGIAHRLLMRDGRVKHLYEQCETHYGPDDKALRSVGTVQDITERTRAEAENAKLQLQLAHSQKMESVGRLAGGVAHDFNNLLMGIMGYADLCRTGLPPEHPVRPHVDEITEIVKRSANLTRQLLAFARRQTVMPRVLDLNDTVAGMLKLLQRLIGEDIVLAWIPGADLWLVKIDPSQIDQLLANLCINARDAIGGTGRVTVESENVSLDDAYCADHAGATPGDYVLLSVSDNGCGMEKETVSHIFEPFFTTKDIGKGTGLGLATVYGIVKQNQGYITVYSEPGTGTTFKIFLPRHQGPTPDKAGPRAGERPRGSGETILLVEDEKSLQVTCGRCLRELGYEVLVAESPACALDLAVRHPGNIHLLLTNVIMPGMNGKQLAEKFAAIKPGARVLFMSGYTADAIVHQGILDKGGFFIGKPFSNDELARKVHEVLEPH
jgi:two-component system, cell cycle sensor histidine kinase and response regulator CckA